MTKSKPYEMLKTGDGNRKYRPFRMDAGEGQREAPCFLWPGRSTLGKQPDRLGVLFQIAGQNGAISWKLPWLVADEDDSPRQTSLLISDLVFFSASRTATARLELRKGFWRKGVPWPHHGCFPSGISE